MSHEAIRSAIESRFLTQWSSDATNTRTPVAFENVAGLITKLDGTIGYTEPKGLTAWVRLSVRDTTSNTIDINPASRVRTSGDIILQVFVQRGVGTQALRQWVDLAIPIFEGRQFSDVNCWEASYIPIGHDAEWYQGNVVWEFYTDRIMSVA